MTAGEILERLRALGSDAVRQVNARNGRANSSG